MIYGLIPAAGHSRRMGRPKLALPLGNRTVLECVISALKQAGVGELLVVVGPHVPELVPLAEEAGAHVFLLSEETADMRATVEQGLQWLEERFHPNTDDWWLLAPADHPALEPDVVRSLVKATRENPRCSLVVPTFQGRRGHPTLIAWKHCAGVRLLPKNLGLNSYLRQSPEETLEVIVGGPRILLDLDTPEDYRQLREFLDCNRL